MARTIGEFAKGVKRAGRAVYHKAETEFLVAQGRKAVANKVQTAKAVTKKAVRTGLILGAIGAAAVVVREAKKRRTPG